MTHRSLLLTAAVGAGLALAAVCPPTASAAAPVSLATTTNPGAVPAAAPAAAPASFAFRGTPRIGALFSSTSIGPGRHFCSASVVDSPGRDLVVTAAHCVVTPGSGRAKAGLVFVPGYHDGAAPYGRWSVRQVTADVQWSVHANQDFDVAFLTVAPDGAGRRLQDVVGSEAIGFNTTRTAPAVAVGYPRHTDRPVYCTSRLRRFTATQTVFDCTGLPGGTSGGPLLTGTGRGGSGRGTLVGVIGGYQQGGDTPDISYSPYFGSGIAAVYRAAAARS